MMLLALVARESMSSLNEIKYDADIFLTLHIGHLYQSFVLRIHCIVFCGGVPSYCHQFVFIRMKPEEPFISPLLYLRYIFLKGMAVTSILDLAVHFHVIREENTWDRTVSGRSFM